MKSYQWCDFDFDTEMFPDAAGYLKRLKERGLKISVWTNPYVGQASPLFKEGKKNGYFIKVSLGKLNFGLSNLLTTPSEPTVGYGNGITGRPVWLLSTSQILLRVSGINPILFA